jgi:hypothetical protein
MDANKDETNNIMNLKKAPNISFVLAIQLSFSQKGHGKDLSKDWETHLLAML